MKVPPTQADSFVKAPPDDARAVLVYGPDRGLVRERAAQLAAAIVADPADPFLTEDLSVEAVQKNAALLLEAAAAMGLGGARRVVRLRDAEDAAATALKQFLQDPPEGALVIVTAGDLSARSPLRRQFESDGKYAFAVACYGDDAGLLRRLVQEMMGEDEIRLSPDALSWLQTHLGADRGASRLELEKLRLYAGGGGALELEDVIACIGDAAAMTLEDAVYAVADGNALLLETALARLRADGTQPIALLRAMLAHVTRLSGALAERERGLSVDQALSALKPPVFWKVAPRFKTQLAVWDRALCVKALTTLLEAESAAKRTGAPALLLTERALHRVAALANSRRRGGR